MSGHSKWAQIKRQKGQVDIKRGQAFTKVANEIALAVKQGGGITDPEKNFRLRLTIEKARAINMPKENVGRAVERGKGSSTASEATLEEVVYEGFGPGGVGIIVEAATANRQRTTSDVKNLFEKGGGSLATPGAVSYQFQQKGLITVKKNGKTLDDIFLACADAGAQDLEVAGEDVLVYTEPEALTRVRDTLTAAHFTVIDAQLSRRPTTTVPMSKEEAKRVVALVERFEAMDDVQRVFANFDIHTFLV